MQLTIQQLRAAVLEHVSADWVRENFGKLTLKATWQDAYDRTREYAAAKLEQAATVTQEAAIDLRDTALLLADNCDGLPVAIAETTQTVLVWCIKAIIIGWLFCLEMAREGAIDELMAEVQRLEQQREARLLSLLDKRISSTVRIAA